MRRFSVPFELDLLASLRPLVASTNDPTIRVRRHAFVRASRTPVGPATLLVERESPERFRAEAFGPGASWALDAAPGLVGVHDDPCALEELFRPDARDRFAQRVVARAHHERPGLRMIRTGCVQDVLVPTILGQRVTAREAARSWTRLVRAWGEPAPGPYGLRLPPAAERLAATPSWAFHRHGVEHARARRISRACRDLPQLQAALDGPLDGLDARLRATPGIGPWTAALLRRAAAGDVDAVEVGDDGLKHQVAWSLAREARGSDARMLELLAPFAPQRGRVVRLLLSTGTRAPGFAGKPRVVPVEQL